MHFSPLLLAAFSFASALAIPTPNVKRDDYTTCLNDCVNSYDSCDPATRMALSILGVLQSTLWQVIPMLSLHPMTYTPYLADGSDRRGNQWHHRRVLRDSVFEHGR